MRTKLLLLLLVAFNYSTAQINVNEGFESGAAPAGWTSEGGITTTPVQSTFSCNGLYSLIGNTMSSANPFVVIYTTSYVSNGNEIAASFKHRTDSTTGFVNVYFYYEINNSGTWNLIASDNYITTSCRIVSATLGAGVVPNGSSVKFRMQINSTVSFPAYFDDFSAIQTGSAPTFGAVAEYTFDNTYNNVLGTNPFQSNAGTSFVEDRNGNAAGALGLVNLGTAATILQLPLGAASRTISVWAKATSLNPQINYVFHYGTSGNGNGLAFRPNTTLYFANAAANLETPDTNTADTWIHYVCTYDGTTAKIYKNGSLFSSGAKAFNTVNASNIFKLGLTESNGYSYFVGAVDDLKIYNYSLSQEEITNLYTNNTLTAENFNAATVDVQLYPNPARDVLNIETTIEIQTIEMFTIHGQKVLESNQNQMDVSNLTSGMYLVKIKDVHNHTTTKKVIIK